LRNIPENNNLLCHCSGPSHSTLPPDELNSHILCILQILHHIRHLYVITCTDRNTPRYNTMQVYRPYTEHHTFTVHRMISYRATSHYTLQHIID